MAPSYDSQNIIDIDFPIKERKTISDVLTVNEAIKSKKSSKNHKLHIKRRTDKIDRTKSKENKAISKIISNRISHKGT